jgi:hypothetical protein
MARKSCRLFGPDELAKAAEHIAFEILHFRSYSALKTNAELRAACPAATQAVGYALLLHLRVLIEFFFCEPEQDDCHVVHFRALPGFTASFPPDIHERTPHTDEVTKYLNKLLAHFTANRWEDHRPAWDFYDEYSPVVAELATKFEAALQGEAKAAYDRGQRRWLHHSPTMNLPQSHGAAGTERKTAKSANITKIGFFHFAEDETHADPIGKLAAELRQKDESGSLIVLPEAFNIGCDYYNGTSPTTDASVLRELQTLSIHFGVSFVAGLIISSHGDPYPPHSSAYLIDENGFGLLTRKRCQDSSRQRYTPCETEDDSRNAISYRNIALGAVVCMDAFTQGAHARANDSDAGSRRERLSLRLEKIDGPKVVCIPAQASGNGPEDFYKGWLNAYVVLANGRSTGKEPLRCRSITRELSVCWVTARSRRT